jgi:pimeloyl-ACP methyl ester carboxylesterase
VSSGRSPYAERLAEVAVSRHVAIVDGVETTWWDYGPNDRPVDLVMVHGFRGDHHGLEPFVAALGPRVRVLIPDLPGFGATRGFAGTADIGAYASWLSAFFSTHASEASLLGHSFGSIVVAAARASGLSVRATILVNPIAANALQGPRGFMTKLAVGYYALSAKLPERWGYALLRNKAIVRVMSVTMAKTTDKNLRRWIHEQHDEYFSVFDDRRSVLEAFRASVRNDVGQFAQGLTGPVLMVVADRDDITTLVRQRELASRLSDVSLHVVRNVGHLVHYEAADEAADVIRDFLTLPSVTS